LPGHKPEGSGRAGLNIAQFQPRKTKKKALPVTCYAQGSPTCKISPVLRFGVFKTALAIIFAS
jgi:hypothetical protein